MLKQIFIILLITIQLSSGLYNGVAFTPTMGWISSQTFKCNIDCDTDPTNCLSQDNIFKIADIMVADGYLAMGYQYIIIDKCWTLPIRDENGNLQADPKRFPNGMPATADYLHNLGLKLGLYANYGSQTCNGFPGSIEFLETDAAIFDDWGVDYVKLDACGSDIESLADNFLFFDYYLGLTGSPITYSCLWPYYERKAGVISDYEEISSFCNNWQNTDEITNDILSIIKTSEFISRNQNIFSSVQGPGAFNYAGQLVIGNIGITASNAVAQMALWSIFASPLLMTADLRNIEERFFRILTNPNIISINQDDLGLMGRKILIVDTYVAVYAKLLQSDEIAFVCVNWLSADKTITISLKDLGLTLSDSYNLFETFGGILIGTFQNDQRITITVGKNYGTFSFWASPASNLNQKINFSRLKINKTISFNEFKNIL